MYDIIVSGAGPAGSLAAMQCARQGLSVLLLDKATKGRRKCCAGGVVRRAEKELGLKIPERLVENRINGVSFLVEGTRYSFPLEEDVALIVRREAFDGFLVEEAVRQGATLIEEAKVSAATEEGQRVKVITAKGSFEARFLVVAEGAGSAIARALYGKSENPSTLVGCAVEVNCARAPRRDVDIHLSSYRRYRLRVGTFPLTGGVFPLGESVMLSYVGWKEPREAFERAIDSSVRIIADEYGGSGMIGRPCYHAIPIAIRARFHTANTLVVGDAAGLVSPFSGEGLTSAFQSARIASEVLVEASMGKSSLAAYEARSEARPPPPRNAAEDRSMAS